MSVRHDYLREVFHDGQRVGWLFHCPGCDAGHLLDQRWTFDGNLERPTFQPSLLSTWPEGRCHLFVRGGQIEYLGDCSHALAGKTVPMEVLE